MYDLKEDIISVSLKMGH